jgi:hypothetical protein
LVVVDSPVLRLGPINGMAVAGAAERVRLAVLFRLSEDLQCYGRASRTVVALVELAQHEGVMADAFDLLCLGVERALGSVEFYVRGLMV